MVHGRVTPFALHSLADLRDLAVDAIVDVRSPGEFAEDHLPGAVSMPVLDDRERAEVGTMYTRVDRFRARRLGGALVARNTAAHLQGPLAELDGGWQPLVYCWRGGQRSGAFATILDQVGWRVRVLKGGYRSYRRAVVAMLYEAPLPHRLVVVDGGTGTAKTALLHALAERGAPVLDLEALAAHRGSLFGATAREQPTQKMFDSRIAAALGGFDPERPVFVEAESSKVGERAVPPSLWRAMGTAPRVRLVAPLAARTRFLVRAYRDLLDDPARLVGPIEKLRPYHSRERIETWQAQAAAGDWEALAGSLVEHHYDRRYAKGEPPPAAHTVELDELDDATLARTADALLARFR